jgi:hypothetical protein
MMKEINRALEQRITGQAHLDRVAKDDLSEEMNVKLKLEGREAAL